MIAALFDEKRLRASYGRSLPKGAKLLEVKCGTKDGWKRSAAKIRYDALDAARKGLLFRTATLKKNPDGSYRLALQAGDGFLASSMKGPAGKVMLQHQVQMCSFMRNSYSARVPGEVLKTNAHGSKGGTVRWSYAKGDPELKKRIRARMEAGRYVTFKGEGLKLKEFAKPLKRPGGIAGVFGYREGGARKRTVPRSRKITVDKSRFSAVYPAVWFSPSTGEITAIKNKKKVEVPPEKKYEIWIEPDDPEFAFLRGRNPQQRGFVLIGKGRKAFENPEVPEDPTLSHDIDRSLMRKGPKDLPVYYCKAKNSACVIMITEVDSKKQVLSFEWKRLKEEKKK